MKKLICMILVLIIAVISVAPITSFSAEAWLWPVPSSRTINQYYSSSHDGLDIGGAHGCDVVASMAGTVVYSNNGDIAGAYYGGGNFVVIKHSNGYYSHYAHLNSRSVSAGQNVSKGQKIGTMGSTGNSSGTHLHFAVATCQYGSGGRINVNPGTLNYTYSSATGNDPQGCVDSITGGNGKIHISGWAFDKDTKNTALTIHVYIGGPAGSGAEVHAITANKSRPDVNKVYGVGEKHGFNDDVPTSKTGSQKIYIYALNTGAGNNPQIGSGTVNITKDTTKPTISNVKISNVTLSGYTVTFTATDNVGIQKVQCPTWTLANDQDDIKWDEKVTKNGNNYSCTIKTSEHKNETGQYATHIYAYDYAGNYTTSSLNTIDVLKTAQETCSHTFTSKVTKSATCTESGEKTLTCSACKLTKTEQINALGHSFGAWQTTKPATCTEEGLETRVCSRDNTHKETRIVEKKKHTPEQEIKENIVEATCSQAGSFDIVVYCSSCGAEIQRQHKTVAPAHKFETTVIEPTINSVGHILKTCSVCGYSCKNFTAQTGKVTGVKCLARTAASEKFTWTAIAGVGGYQVELLDASGNSARIKVAKTNVYTYTDLKVPGYAYKVRVRTFIKADDGNYYFGPWSDILNSPTLPKGTSLTSLTRARKAFTAKWKKGACTGYQLQFSRNSKFSSAKTVTINNAKTLKYTAKKLSAYKYYYVRIRTYKAISGKNYFSTWSKSLKVKTK